MASSTLQVLISSKRASLISDKCLRFHTSLKLTITMNNEIKTGSVSSVYSTGTLKTQYTETRNSNIFLNLPILLKKISIKHWNSNQSTSNMLMYERSLQQSVHLQHTALELETRQFRASGSRLTLTFEVHDYQTWLSVSINYALWVTKIRNDKAHMTQTRVHSSCRCLTHDSPQSLVEFAAHGSTPAMLYARGLGVGSSTKGSPAPRSRLWPICYHSWL